MLLAPTLFTAAQVCGVQALALHPAADVGHLDVRRHARAARRHEIAVREIGDGPAILVESAAEGRAIVVDCARRLGILARADEVNDVRCVVLHDGDRAVEDDHAERLRREDPHRVAAHGDLHEAVTLRATMGDEAPGHEPRQAPFDAGLVGVHVLHQDILITPEKALDPLVFRSHVEERRLRVRRQARRVLLQPSIVVGPSARPALREGHVERQEAGRLRPLGGRAHQRAERLDVGQRVEHAPAYLDRRGAAAVRVSVEASAAEGPRPVDGHGRDRLRGGGYAVMPEAITQDREKLVESADLGAHVGCSGRRSARRVEAPRHEQLAADLGDPLVDDAGRAERGPRGGPERELIEERARGGEREAEHGGDVEVLPARLLDDAVKEDELVGLDDFHALPDLGVAARHGA